MVHIMVRNAVKSVLCLLIIALIFTGLGCAGRGDHKSDQPGTPAATPMPVSVAPGTPVITPSPAPTMTPGNAGNYTTTLSVDDVSFSGGDEEYAFPEDALPTPSAE